MCRLSQALRSSSPSTWQHSRHSSYYAVPQKWHYIWIQIIQSKALSSPGYYALNNLTCHFLYHISYRFRIQDPNFPQMKKSFSSYGLAQESPVPSLRLKSSSSHKSHAYEQSTPRGSAKFSPFRPTLTDRNPSNMKVKVLSLQDGFILEKRQMPLGIGCTLLELEKPSKGGRKANQYQEFSEEPSNGLNSTEEGIVIFHLQKNQIGVTKHLVKQNFALPPDTKPYIYVKHAQFRLESIVITNRKVEISRPEGRVPIKSEEVFQIYPLCMWKQGQQARKTKLSSSRASFRPKWQQHKAQHSEHVVKSVSYDEQSFLAEFFKGKTTIVRNNSNSKSILNHGHQKNISSFGKQNQNSCNLYGLNPHPPVQKRPRLEINKDKTIKFSQAYLKHTGEVKSRALLSRHNT